MAQVTYSDFSAMVLALLGVPVTANNISKINAVGVQEGKHGTFNIMNWVTASGQSGETNYNSVGVKNYPNLSTGVIQTAKGLQQGNTSAMLANLKTDGPYAGWVNATSAFYGSWGGGPLSVNQTTAQNAGSTPLEGNTTQDAIDLAKNQIGADKGAAVQSDPITAAAGVASGIVNAATSIPDFLSWIKNAVLSKDNWIRIGMVIGALMLSFWGMSMISHNFGGPSAGDITKVAAKGAMV
jgi:hypothetical protein